MNRLPAHLRAKIEVRDGCWVWVGARSGNGYGGVKLRGRYWCAHRLVYTLLVGPIPDGLQLDHVKARGCTSTLCVNPDHLEPVTSRENQLRGGGAASLNARKTHCPHGHPLDGRRGSGRRYCLTCNRRQTAESAARRKAA